LLLLTHAALAQYRIDSWTADNGLPVGSVNQALQTRDGYLWMCTYGGLVRYDGASLQVFNVINSKGLLTSRFTWLFEDRIGDLWAGTENHGVVRRHNGEFTSYTTQDGLKTNDFSAGRMFYDDDGRQLLDSRQGLVEWKNGRFVPGPADAPSEENRIGIVLGRNAAGASWFSNASGLHRFEHGRVVATYPLHFAFKRVCEDRSGRLWMEYEQPGGFRTLASYQNGKLREFTAADGVPRFRTFGCMEDRRGVMWFGLQNGGGLLRIEDGTKVTRITTAQGLPSNNVQTPIEDREGTIWAPSDGGLSWLTRQVVHSYSSPDGLASDNAYSVFEDHTGGIWIGTWPGVTLYRNGIFTRRPEFGSVSVQSFLETKEGEIWIGTFGDCIRRVRNGRMEQLCPPMPGGVVRAMLQDRSGDIWAGGNGLARYHDGAFQPIDARNGFAGHEVFSIFQDRAGDIWVGTGEGVSRFSGGGFTNFDERQGFAGKMVRSFYEDAGGALWMGTYDTGLFRYANDKFKQYTTREGLADNGAFRILEDRRGNFWMSSNAGIYRVAKKDLDDVAAGRSRTVTSVIYGKRDGMLSAESNGGSQPAGIQARDGRLWFPTQKGVAVIDPESITPIEQPPPVVIEQALVDRQPMPAGAAIRIEPGQSGLEIRYAALTFLAPELARFRYKLEPLDPDWVDAGSRRVAYYAHLPFGTYRFQVIAANRDGVWNRQGASLGVEAVPPFWRTWWFEILAAAAAAAAGLFFYHSRIRQLRQEQAAYEMFSRQLIESQERERKRIAGELHDSLSQTLSIIKNRATLSLQPDKQESALGQMEEIAEAAGEALGEVREIVHGLRPVEIDRLGLTKATRAMVKRVASSSGIRIRAEVDELDGAFPGDKEMIVYRIVQEGLSNIVKHSGAADAVVRIQRRPQGVEIVVQDNGRGFMPEAAGVREGAGLGLMSISERARMLGAKFQLASAPGQGTTLTIRIATEAGPHAK
jgi:signal transduction histidine kinase/ligand-binding sensor domain-containing protein